MKKVLFINYLFPPLGGGGVIRIAKFIKYLPNFGWKIFALAPEDGFYPIKDDNLLNEIQDRVEITRVKYIEPGRWSSNRYWQVLLSRFFYKLLIPDRQILWLLPAILRGYRLIKGNKIKIIFTSSPAYSDALVALILKKLTKAKWVVDFRDEWSNNNYLKMPTPFHCLAAKWLEKRVIESADAVISVSYPMTTYFRSLTLTKKKLVTLTNGFDSDDFKNTVMWQKDNKFKIVHVGALYGSRKPNTFLKAIRELNLKGIKPIFIGQDKRVSHADSLKCLMGADILLLVLSPTDSSAVLTGKIFEYLAARRPILALAPERTAAAKLIHRLNAGIVADPHDTKAIKEAILIYYRKWQRNDLSIREVNLDVYNRQNITAKLGRIFDELLPSPAKIKLVIIGNVQSYHNLKVCKLLLETQKYELSFISHMPGKIKGVKNYRFLPYQRGPKLLWFFRTVQEIKRIVKDIKPDALYGQNLLAGGIWAYLTGFQPFIVTIWGSDLLGYDKLGIFNKYYLRQTLKSASIVTGDASVLLDKVKTIGIKPNYTEFIFGVDVQNFKKMKSEDLRNKLKLKAERIIFSPRSIAPIYNIDIIIKAFAKLAKQYPDAKLALLKNIYDKNYYKKIRCLIEALGLTQNVIYLPPVDNQRMVNYYNLADVVISIPSSDTCSVSFLEAMACENKIILTDLPYLKDWRRGNNFWKVKVGDIENTYQALTKSLQMPDKKFRKTGQLNRELVTSKGEINANIEKLNSLIEGLLQ